MIRLLTKVNIVDNSGGLSGQCIKVISPAGRDYAKIGDVILVSIKELRAGHTPRVTGAGSVAARARGSSLPSGAGAASSGRNATRKGSSVNSGGAVQERGSMFRALVVRTKQGSLQQKYGYAKFQDNAVVLIKSDSSRRALADGYSPLGTSILHGPLSLLLLTFSNSRSAESARPLQDGASLGSSARSLPEGRTAPSGESDSVRANLTLQKVAERDSKASFCKKSPSGRDILSSSQTKRQANLKILSLGKLLY